MYFEKAFSDFYIAHKYDEVPQNSGYPYHFHTDYEMIYFMRGEVTQCIEGKKCKVEPGNIVFCRPGEYHSLIISPEVAYERYIIRFSPLSMPPELVSELNSRNGCHILANDTIYALFVSLCSHFKNYNGEHSYNLLQCTLRQILYYFCCESRLKKMYIDNAKILKIMDYVNDNISNGFSLEDICKHTGLSESYMCKEFQGYMKTTVISYARTKRVMLAEAFMAQGERPTDIFKVCGFTDYSTFFRTYKKVMSSIPSNRYSNVQG